MGFSRKEAGISLAAPQLWQNKCELEVLSHVQKDAILTMSVYVKTVLKGSMEWITQKGKTKVWNPTFSQWVFGRNIETVSQCLLRPKHEVPYITPRGLDRDYALAWMPCFHEQISDYQTPGHEPRKRNDTRQHEHREKEKQHKAYDKIDRIDKIDNAVDKRGLVDKEEKE
jgi:hypothetical protein